MRTHLFAIAFSTVLPLTSFAHPVINEVLWAGSDIGTTDEWIEIYNHNPSPINLSGWTVTSLNSKGEHVTVSRFVSGTVLDAESYAVIARKSAGASALALEPFLIAPDLVLPNTNLLLRFVDQFGVVVDEVDDGTGVPFAGANPSGSGAKASMERIDPLVSGTNKQNWRTAFLHLGLDEGSPVFATAGFPNQPDAGAPQNDCRDPLTIGISLQSGTLTGVGKVTVNLQAIALSGVLPSSGCTWDYGDGFKSTSCNPPSHTFTNAGSFIVRLGLKNTCGAFLSAEQSIVVQPDGSSTSSSVYDDGSRLMLAAALPNPEGTDTGREWISIRNSEDRPVLLRGWRLRVGETSSKWMNLKGSIDAHSVLRIYDSEIKISLPNSSTRLTLVSPSSQERSSIEWGSAGEGREYYPVDLKELTVRGRVVAVIGSTVMQVQLERDAAFIAGTDQVFVRLLGVKLVPSRSEDERGEALGLLTDRVKGKTVELEFDREMWDAMGRLLAYVYTDEQLPLQSQLIVTKLWMVDRTLDFLRKKEFLALESPDLLASLFQEDAITDSALSEKKIPVQTLAKSPVWESVTLSEIFPAPDPKFKTSNDRYVTQEWVEIRSSSLSPLSLSGFTLHSGKRKKSLPEGLIVGSGAMLVVSLKDLLLILPNDGTVIRLEDPLGGLVDSVEYQKTKLGNAYARTEDDTWCETRKPTPSEKNECITVIPALTNKKKTKSASATPSPRVKSYANEYLSQVRSQGDHRNIEFTSSESTPSIFAMIGAFFGGIIVTAGILFLALRMGFLTPANDGQYLQNNKKNAIIINK